MRLRSIMWSNWSINLVLNFIAVLIALQFTWCLFLAYRYTKFRGMSFWLAVQLNFQGYNVLSYQQIVLVTISAVPLIVSYHMPIDQLFNREDITRGYPKWLRDVIIVTASTWFNRLGYESVNRFLRIHTLHSWGNNARLRFGGIGIVFLLRITTPDCIGDADYGVWRVIRTCVLSVVLGAFSASVPALLQRHYSNVVPAGGGVKLEKRAESIVVTQLLKEGMPLNRHGLLGHTRHGWSVTGLIVEGWEIVERKHKNETVAMRGRCKVLLKRDQDGKLQDLL